MHQSRTWWQLPPVAFTIFVAAIAHAMLWAFRAGDVDIFLVPWLMHIRATGMIEAFATPFSNYTPPYLYLLALTSPLCAVLSPLTVLKLLSTLGTVALAGSIWRLLVALEARSPERAAALVLILPSTLLNAPLLAQCDAMWAAACVMALAMAIIRRHKSMLAWFGLAIAFKLQAVFFGPFIFALLLGRRVGVRAWLIAPATAFATLLPAWAAGWPITNLLTIYLRQTNHFDQLSLNAPNIWTIVQILPGVRNLPLQGLAMTMAIGGTATYVAWVASRGTVPRLVLPSALLAPLLLVGTLPRMHERYFFLADILAFALAVTMRNRTGWSIAIFVQSGSTLAVLSYVLGIPIPAIIGAAAMIVATYQVAKLVIRSSDHRASQGGMPLIRETMPWSASTDEDPLPVNA
jgi:Gpi18-like mannosyltransferase